MSATISFSPRFLSALLTSVTYLAIFVLLLICGVTPVRAQSAVPAITDTTIGLSTDGRAITAVRVGDGPRKLVLVGDTHGGPEANTYRLLHDLIAHFRAHPEEVPSSVRLYLIPTLNPDGLANSSRLNARGVDLNRNMNTSLDACPKNDWQRTVNGAYGIVSDTGGSAPESEVESRLIRDFLLDASAAIFYHSAGGELFPPYCEHNPSITLAQVYAEEAGYIYTRRYPRYLITGGMHDWAGSMGIASFTPELWDSDGSDTEANHAAIHVILERAEELLPMPQDRVVAGVAVPAVFWRYWRSHGSEEQFGVPLAPAQHHRGRLVQYFERAALELHPESADTPSLVQLARLGEYAYVTAKSIVGAGQPEQRADIRSLFREAWEHGGGTAVYGEPLSPIANDISLVDGSPRLVQYFERVRLEYDPASPTGAVQLSPLGWHTWHRQQIVSPTLTQQIR